MMDRRHRLLPLVLLSYIYLNTLYQFAANGFHYDPRGMPKLFTHRIGPQSLWPITDVVLIFCLGMPTSTFLCLYWDSSWKVYRKCLLLIDYRRVGARNGAPEVTQNGKVLPSEECTKIAAYHRLAKWAAPLVAELIYAISCFFCLGSFAQHWSGSLLHDWLMFSVTGLFLYHATISNCMLMGFFGVTGHFLAIRQRLMLAKSGAFLRQLTGGRRSERRCTTTTTTIFKGSVRRRLKRAPALKATSHLQLWRAHRWLHLELAALLEHISRQNLFWRKYLTIYFFGYTLFSVYFFYIYFFYLEDFSEAQLGWTEKNFYSLFGLEFAALLLFVTWQCSKIVRRNVLLHRNLIAIGRRLQLLTLADRLKSDQLAADRRDIEKSKTGAFTLATGYPINSKMFEMLFSYLSVIFMMVFKDNHQKKARETVG